MKVIYLVLDGVADRLVDQQTSLKVAKKPFLDLISRAGVCGVACR